MKGEPLRVKFKENMTQPRAANCPAPVPKAYTKKVKEDLDRDVRLGVIEKVPANTEQKFCARMLVVPKHNGEPRRVVDFKALNDVCARQTHHTKSPFNVVSDVPANMFMSVADAWNGYHSVRVHPADVDIFTFITEYGRYRYLKVPQGWLAAGDAYTYRYQAIRVDIEDHRNVVDDTIIWASTMREMFVKMANFLTTVGRGGVVLNKKKFIFGQREVEFAGFKLGGGEIRPLDKHIEAIRDFPVPATITDMRSFYAMVEQVSYCAPVKEELTVFREHLKKGSTFYWDEQLDKLFKKCRKNIAEAVVNGIKTFDLEKPTTIESDWSVDGMGYWLRQKHCDCVELKLDCCRTGWQLAGCGSRFCSGAESRYAPVEGELAAICCALERTRVFTLGAKHLTVVTDHKPLSAIIKGEEKAVNARITRLREKFTGMLRVSMHVTRMELRAKCYWNRGKQFLP